MVGFRAKLEPVPHGGHYVAAPARVAERAGLEHAARVRGTVDGEKPETRARRVQKTLGELVQLSVGD